MNQNTKKRINKEEEERNNLITGLIDKSDLVNLKREIDAGADLSANDYRAFRWAVSNGDVNIVEYLLTKDIPLDIIQKVSLETTIWSGFLPMIKLLVENGVIVPLQAIELELKRERTDIVDFLLPYVEEEKLKVLKTKLYKPGNNEKTNRQINNFITNYFLKKELPEKTTEKRIKI